MTAILRIRVDARCWASRTAPRVAPTISAEEVALTVEDEAGIGKSRMLAAALDVARARDLQAVSGRSEELERNRPFGLWTPVAEWLPTLAQALGAKRPMHVPPLLGRLLAGEAGVVMMTELRGASNAKARPELGWRPAHPSWR